MGIGTGAVKFICELASRGIFSNISSVCEAGSQEIYLSPDRFNSIVQSYGITDYPRDLFLDLNKWPNSTGLSAKSLYSILGATNYTCLDLNGVHGSIKHDLNMPFEDKSKWGMFDLVTDYGCNEHCFNVMEAYRTLHRILKPGGYMIILQGRYAETNGYYLMDESFYEGLAAANGYKIVQIAYLVSPSGQEEREHILFPFNREVMQCLDLNNTFVWIISCFQKIRSADFVIPYQGKYLSQRTGNVGYISSSEREPVVRSYLPIESTDQIIEWALQTQLNNVIEQLLKRFPAEVMSQIEKLKESKY